MWDVARNSVATARVRSRPAWALGGVEKLEMHPTVGYALYRVPRSDVAALPDGLTSLCLQHLLLPCMTVSSLIETPPEKRKS